MTKGQPPLPGAQFPRGPEGPSPLTTIEEMEINHIRSVLQQSDGNVMKAAKVLGIARSSLWRKMKKYDIKGKD
jgi:transcriptional regulator with PAS, ATPase and Fis domain